MSNNYYTILELYRRSRYLLFHTAPYHLKIIVLMMFQRHMEADTLRAFRMYHATRIGLLTELFEELEMSFPENQRPFFLEPVGTTRSGIKYRQHGYGVFMQKGEVFVDMDFGSRGEVNGIHPHFLQWFAEENSIPVPFKDWEQARIYFRCLSIFGWIRRDRSSTVYYLRPSIDL